MANCDIVDILSSRARILCLKVLVEFGDGLTLREIESLSGLQIGSVQQAIRGLVKDRIVRMSKSQKRYYFSLSVHEPRYRALVEIFRILEADRVSQRSLADARDGRLVLKFCSDQLALVGQKL